MRKGRILTQDEAKRLLGEYYSDEKINNLLNDDIINKLRELLINIKKDESGELKLKKGGEFSSLK